MVDVLSLKDAVCGGHNGQRARSFLDFFVHRQSLARLLDVQGRIGVFGALDPALETRYALQLLQRETSELASGCVPLFLCGECADLGCGAVTVRVRTEHDCIVWSEFGYEDNLGLGPRHLFEHVPGLRDFWFDKEQYEREIRRFVHRGRRRR